MHSYIWFLNYNVTKTNEMKCGIHLSLVFVILFVF